MPHSGSLRTLVLSYRFWKQEYAGDKTIVGRTLQLNHENYTIVGVMPSRFAFTETVGNATFIYPGLQPELRDSSLRIKLKPGVSLATADVGELQTYLNQSKKETPEHFPASFRVAVQPIIEPYLHRTGPTLALLFASVVILLLIGCANCSVLLLARGEARHHELAIRSAIGASRFRMIRQLLIEACAISFAAAAIGVALSYWLAALPFATHAKRVSTGSPHYHQSPDPRVLDQRCPNGECSFRSFSRAAPVKT